MKQQEAHPTERIQPGDLIEVALETSRDLPLIQRRIVPESGIVRVLESEPVEVAGRTSEEAAKLLTGSRDARGRDADEHVNVRVLRRSAAPTDDATRFRVGESISVTIPQLKAPGMDENNILRVREDGTVTLPMLDPFPVLGMTDETLERDIAKRYADAGLINDAKVIVSRTERFDPARDERIDLLIVLKASGRASGETGAATSPAIEPSDDAPGAATRSSARLRDEAPSTRPTSPSADEPTTRPNQN
jgi:protein involved in polysaccharide export with SLBB domain